MLNSFAFVWCTGSLDVCHCKEFESAHVEVRKVLDIYNYICMYIFINEVHVILIHFCEVCNFKTVAGTYIQHGRD